MATQTVTLATVSDAAGNQATLAIDYDSVSLLVSAVHLTNPTTQPLFAQATGTANSKVYSTTVAAGGSQTLTIGNGKANQLQLTVTPSGKLDGVEYVCYLT